MKKKTHEPAPQVLSLPTGGEVKMRVPSGKDYREWRKFLRDDRGEMIRERFELNEELLVAAVLINDDGTQMFTREEVLRGAMDEFRSIDIEAMKEMASALFGMTPGACVVVDEDREKNSSTTALNE